MSSIPRPLGALMRATLSRDDFERAAADLDDVFARVKELRGPAAARRACMREAISIIAWSIADRAHARIAHERRAHDRMDSKQRRGSMIRDLAQDLRFGVRALGRRPGFTVIAVGVLALGIGSTAAIFTLAERLFLEPPPGVVGPDRLVRLFRTNGSFAGGSISYPDYQDYRDAAASLTGLAAASSGDFVVTARVASRSIQVNVSTITENWFDVLGVRPAAGRFFLASENETPDTHPVAVVSEAFARDVLGGRDVIGSDVLLNGQHFTVVGMLPRRFRGIDPRSASPDVYIPIMMRNAVSPGGSPAWRVRMEHERVTWLVVIGRLREDATVERTRAELNLVASRLYPPVPERDPQGVFVTADYRWTPGTQASLGRLTRVMFAAVLVLLIVAAANVAILLLARASSRGHEVGIRSALGAGRGRLLRQLLAESALLGIAGGLIGLLLSVGAARVAGALLPVTLDSPPSPDGRVLLFTLFVSLLTAIGVGITPALRATRTDAYGLIHGRTRHAGGTRLRDLLVVAQVALSLVLVAGAALFARSFSNARAVPVGFDTDNALMVNVELAPRGYDATTGRIFAAQALDAIRALPGVRSATITRMVPFSGDWTTTLEPWPGAGAAFADGSKDMQVGLNVVTAGYFDAMSIPIVAGRAIEAGDVEGSPLAIVVNETFARTVFGDENPLGRTVPLRGKERPPWTVVGIARDAAYYDFDEKPRSQVYGPHMQMYQGYFAFFVKTAGPPSALVTPVHDAIRAIDPDLAFPRTETLASVYARQLAAFRSSARVVGLTGLVALLLASAGLFGVMSYRVSERTREIGLRMALGATRAKVARAIVDRGLRLTLAGAVLGIAGAIAAGRFIESMLYDVPAKDPLSLVAAPAILIAVALLAVLVPARRAMRVDPMRAMRSD